MEELLEREGELATLRGMVDDTRLVGELPGDDQLARGQDALADLDRIEAVTSAFGWRRMVPGHNAGRRARALLGSPRPSPPPRPRRRRRARRPRALQPRDR